jgi:hypothetical protein
VLFDDNVCGLLFDISCCCVERVIVNDSTCCRTGDRLPVGWLNEKFVGFPVGWVNEKFVGFPFGKLPNENRGTFADD